MYNYLFLILYPEKNCVPLIRNKYIEKTSKRIVDKLLLNKQTKLQR